MLTIVRTARRVSKAAFNTEVIHSGSKVSFSEEDLKLLQKLDDILNISNPSWDINGKINFHIICI